MAKLYEPSSEARNYLVQYYGSIDAMAIMLAFDAGQRNALLSAAGNIVRDAGLLSKPNGQHPAVEYLVKTANEIGNKND